MQKRVWPILPPHLAWFELQSSARFQIGSSIFNRGLVLWFSLDFGFTFPKVFVF
jgi:hypothetical protein